ncbi:MAG: hypothetical protein WCV91_03260 [Candidatus Margulisiibacteriota bacterium]
MFKKLFVGSLVLTMVFVVVAGAQEKGKVSVKTKAAKKAVLIKAPIAKPVVNKPQVKAIKPEISSKEQEDTIGDLKEDTNKAIADLKAQIDSVKADNSDVKVGSTIFFRWQKWLQNGTASNVNNFDIDRAYLDFKKKLSGGASARVTLDVARITGAARQNLFDYLKYAYIEVPLNIPSEIKLIPLTVTAKIGLQHTVWIDWADKIMDLRYIAKSLVDNEGVMSSSDFGVGALGTVSIAGLPDIEYQGTFLNGSGYATNETDSKKDLGLRINSTVADLGNYGKVIIGAFGNIKGATSSDFGGTTKQVGILTALKGDNGTAYAEYLRGTRITGYSIGGKYMFLPGVWAFARADNYDPSTLSSNNEISRNFYGLTYDWSKDVKVAADVQTSQTGSGVQTSIFYLHMLTVL